MFRSKSWFGGNSFWKPKNLHSLESLKYLYNVLSKNQTVNENNRSLLVETLRSIAEILIWGDQNDSTVFDFFLEKNMLSFFLKIMKQKCGSYVCVQLLQTLNILFENIRNETSLYYLLSNNHVNSIIVHKFDFSDEEVMAYYISFLKTLSLKLNPHTIHFFYNESTNDFPLYTEAIKFFNNGESMVRIAVRTLTLNVYKVEDKNMLNMIRDKTAAPYFSNLVWFIGNHVLELDNCIRDCCSGSHELRPKLADLAAEHLDHLHYINDILHLGIDDLNQVLADHLLHRLFIPLYVSSLDRNYVPKGKNPPPKISSILSLFLLSQVFLILNHKPLVRILARIILNGNESVFSIPENITTTAYSTATAAITNHEENSENSETVSLPEETPEERRQSLNLVVKETLSSTDLSLRPFLNSVLDALDSTENDYAVLFGLCLLRSLHENKGINQELLSNYFANDHVAIKEVEDESENVQIQHKYNEQLVEKLISIIGDTVKLDSKVRLVTLQLAISLILKVVMDGAQSFLGEKHLKDLEGARGENILLLQNYFKHDELFLEIFEDEYLDMSSMKEVSVEYLLMDSNFLLPPVGSPLTGITFDKRLPCGDLERSRRSIRVYFLLRRFHLTLKNEPEKYLPLINTQNCVMIDDSLDLTNSDLVSCVVITKDNTKTRRFMVIDIFQLILVEPSPKRSGWGIAKFVGFLQDIEVLGDKSDNRVLHITVKSSPTQHFSQGSSQSKAPVLVAKFLFEDYIRCMACKTRLIKGKQKARERKLFMIARLLDIVGTSPSPPQNVRRHARQRIARADRPPTHHYTPLSKTLPGLAIAVVNENDDRRKSREQSPSASSLLRSQEEEIPLGKIRNNHTKIGSQQSSSTSVGHGMTLNLNAPKNNTSTSGNQKNNESSINQHQTNEILSPQSVTTPQSETSFISSFSSPNPSSSPPNSSSKKKKGTIETV